MDQLIFASLSHTHYWYEVRMLKVPAYECWDFFWVFILFFCVAGLLYSPVRLLVDVKVFRVLQRAINTSKAGPNVSVTPIDPSETPRVFTDDLE